MEKEKTKSHRLPILFYHEQYKKIDDNYKKEGHADRGSYVRWIINQYFTSKNI